MRLRILVIVSCWIGIVLGCKGRGEPDSRETPQAAGGAGPSSAESHGSAVLAGTHAPAHSAHGAGEAPIDCPLRKHGIDPGGLRPFDDVAKYIAFLERADRAVWQRPDAVVAALRLAGNETVVDVGAGSGYFTFRFARAVPQGKVIATDVEPAMVRHVHHKSMVDKVPNVHAVLATDADPGIPDMADLVFLCDVLHHIPDRGAWLGKIVSRVRKGTRFAVIEFKEGKLPEGPPESIKLPKGELTALARGAGLELVRDEKSLLPYQSFLLFRKP